MKRSILLLTSALALSASAWANVDITYNGKSTSAPILKSSETGSMAVGQLNYTDSVAGSFVAYCIEPSQINAAASLGSQSYSVGSFTGAQATLLQGLFSTHYASANDVTSQAAFQFAVWEIMRETNPTLNVSLNQGSFYVRPKNATAGEVAIANNLSSLANGYLSDAQSYSGPSLYSLTRLSNATYQDLVTATPVPEPMSGAMLMSGLAVLGLLARRRMPR